MPRYSKRRESDLRRVSRQSASPRGRHGRKESGHRTRRRDNNDLSRRDIMLIRNLQFFLRASALSPPLAACALAFGRDRDGAFIGFLTNYNTRTTLLDYKLLIMPVGRPARVSVPIFGGPARKFRCIIYGRFNEQRKRSKGPRGLFLIIRREGTEGAGRESRSRASCTLSVAHPPAFLSLLLLYRISSSSSISRHVR